MAHARLAIALATGSVAVRARGPSANSWRNRLGPNIGSGRGCALAAILLLSGLALRGEKKPADYDVKAAYLFDLGRFIRVSPNAAIQRSTFDICVLGQDLMGSALDSAAESQQIDHRQVRIRHLKEATEARSCDIAFIGASEGDRMESDLGAIRGSDVLTVSDAAHFLADGGMIQFVLVEHRVRFSVNLEAVKRSHLVLSSELLRVAVSVSGAPGEGLP
jgi:hypothetical protein